MSRFHHLMWINQQGKHLDVAGGDKDGDKILNMAWKPPGVVKTVGGLQYKRWQLGKRSYGTNVSRHSKDGPSTGGKRILVNLMERTSRSSGWRWRKSQGT